MAWNVKETRELVEKRFGRKQLHTAKPSLHSLFERPAHAQYHVREARRLLEGFVGKHIPADASMLEVIFGDSDEVNHEFNLFLIEAGAHMTACVISMHSMADIFAHALYYSLGLNLRPDTLHERDINANTVTRCLSADTAHQPFARALVEFTTGGSFKHLAALANYSKHRSIVRAGLNERHGETPRHTVRLGAFSHRGVSYPDCGVRDFLAPEYDRCSKLIVDTGNELNAYLASAP
jgi:hypothetical protein